MMSADLYLQRREYLIADAACCQTCGEELTETMVLEVYGPAKHDVHGYCNERCADNYDGAPLDDGREWKGFSE